MSWTPEQLSRHPKHESLLGKASQPIAQAVARPPVTEPPVGSAESINFIVMGDPMGKPRMTQRDTWKQRPVVLRYRDYCDRIREAAPNRALTADVYDVDVLAFIAMPKSWSRKKQVHHWGLMHRTKPDWDNIGKAVCDALFKEDSGIAVGRVQKFWCAEGEQRTEIKLKFNP